jgi:hypothetical protein
MPCRLHSCSLGPRNAAAVVAPYRGSVKLAQVRENRMNQSKRCFQETNLNRTGLFRWLRPSATLHRTMPSESSHGRPISASRLGSASPLPMLTYIIAALIERPMSIEWKLFG